MEEQSQQWTPTPRKGDPPGVSGGLPPPARHHHQDAGGRERNDAHDDEEQRGDPLGGQLRRDAVAVPPVNGLALLDQAHGERAWKGDIEG